MKVVLLPRALRDVERIRNYIFKESGSPEVADAFIARLLEACRILGTAPEGFPPYHQNKRWQMMPFEKYVVLFEAKNNRVFVGLIRHSSRMPFRS